ncbi:MAG: hypothetical protein ACE5F4_01710 [Candidatus Paceibacteria bacterium]
MAKEIIGAGALTGLGIWAWRAAAVGGLLGTGAATMYYKGKAEAVSEKAESAALELERQKVELAQEQARLADIQRQQAELAQQRAELDSAEGLDLEVILGWGAAGALAAVLVFWGVNSLRKRKKEQQAYA